MRQAVRTGSRVPILLYHSLAAPGHATDDHWQVRAGDFRVDMTHVLESGRSPMTADQYACWLLAGAEESVRPVLVTFDDGFADYADVALPILVELGLCSTVFVTSGYLGRPGMLSATALADTAAEHECVEVGAHSVTHPHLDTLAAAVARDEILGSRKALEQVTGRAITSFAYPHGSYHGRTRSLVVESGYRTAHAVKDAVSHPRDDPFALARFTVTAATTRQRVRAVLAGEGAPAAWRGRRLRTRGYRVVRKARAAGLLR